MSTDGLRGSLGAQACEIGVLAIQGKIKMKSGGGGGLVVTARSFNSDDPI